jgi:hypothetical protein
MPIVLEPILADGAKLAQPRRHSAISKSLSISRSFINFLSHGQKNWRDTDSRQCLAELLRLGLARDWRGLAHLGLARSRLALARGLHRRVGRPLREACDDAPHVVRAVDVRLILRMLRLVMAREIVADPRAYGLVSDRPPERLAQTCGHDAGCNDFCRHCDTSWLVQRGRVDDLSALVLDCYGQYATTGTNERAD